ncbi:MAG: hypothetical protein ACLUD0_06800 [Eubacterium ramulus]
MDGLDASLFRGLVPHPFQEKRRSEPYQCQLWRQSVDAPVASGISKRKRQGPS